MIAKKIFIFAVALFLSTAMFAEQREVVIERKFNAWSEVSQSDTTLTLYVKYGKVLYDQPLRIQQFALQQSHGNPNVQAVSTSFYYTTTIKASAPEKFLRRQTYQTIEKVNVASQIYYFRKSLMKAKELYEKWSKVAKDEHVTNYHKAVTDKEIYDIPCIYNCFSDNKTFHYSVSGSQKDILKMEFIVDSLGNCKLYWGIPNNHNPTFYRQQVEAQYGGLVKKDITKAYKIVVPNAGLWFNSAEQIQSLIDVLELESIVKECQALYDEKNKKDSRDDLFK